MRTIKTVLYNFSELSEGAKEKAIQNHREKYIDYSFYYDEIIESVKAVVELFGLKTGNEYSDIRTGHIEDTILNLSGIRLYKYLINNYGSKLFTPKYIKTLDRKVSWKPFKCTYFKNREGKEFTQIHSKLKTDNSCTLTGVCYDMDILEPVYNFLQSPDKNTTFEELIGDIESAISKTFRDTEDWINSDEFITDEIEANNYEFTEEGKLI